MSDYLQNLVARSLNRAESVRPRAPSLFEPLRPALTNSVLQALASAREAAPPEGRTQPFASSEAAAAAPQTNLAIPNQQHTTDEAASAPDASAHSRETARQPTLDARQYGPSSRKTAHAQRSVSETQPTAAQASHQAPTPQAPDAADTHGVMPTQAINVAPREGSAQKSEMMPASIERDAGERARARPISLSRTRRAVGPWRRKRAGTEAAPFERSGHALSATAPFK